MSNDLCRFKPIMLRINFSITVMDNLAIKTLSIVPSCCFSMDVVQKYALKPEMA